MNDGGEGVITRLAVVEIWPEKSTGKDGREGVGVGCEREEGGVKP